MSAGKKVGYFFLGLSPVAAVLMWQIMATSGFMMLYMIQQMATPEFQQIQIGSQEYNQAVNQMALDFQSSSMMFVATFAIYIGYLIIFGLWYYFMFCKNKQTGTYKQVLKPHRIISILAAGIMLQIGMDMALVLILPLFPTIYENYMGLMESLGSDSVFMMISVSILAPIGEELIFRGLTFRIFRKIMPWQVAMVIQAVLFGAYHLNIVQGVYATLLGFAMGYLAYKYGSVIPGILLHMAINSSSYFVGYLFPDSLEEQPVIMVIIGVVALAITVVLLGVAGKGVVDLNEQGMQTAGVNEDSTAVVE